MTQLAPAVVLLVALAAQPAGFRIVVIEGEDAVNVIQQKTAVRPVVEVRDRNDVPVAGVLVTFSIEGGTAASFGGASTFTVATNAAGQAAVSSLTPSAAGAFQIQVAAAFQGQLATATIAQTNVMTAAQAAAAASAGTASASGGGGGAGAGGGAGGGGGVSATTVGIVGAAVGGAALAATQLVKDAEAGHERYTGTMTGQIVSTHIGGSGSVVCTTTRNVTADVTLTFNAKTDASVRGVIELIGTDAVAGGTCIGPGRTNQFRNFFDFSGTPSSFTARDTLTETGPVIDDPRLTRQSTTEIVIEASVSGDTVTATLKFNERSTITGGQGGVVNESATGTFPFTLRRTA